MFEADEEKIIRDLFRDSMREELARPEVRAAKEQLVGRHFSVRPVSSVASFAFVIPAVFLLALAFAFQHLQMAPAGKPISALFPVLGPQATVAGQPYTSPARPVSVPQESGVITQRPRVEVKRIASRVGPTMVYQKTFRDTPVTIIWVFAGGSR